MPNIFSVFDLTSGFHQVETHPEDRAKTVFSSTRGHFEYLRMPMGIKNAPATFQRLMDTVLKGMHGTEVFVYLDDIVVYAESLDEHDKKARRLFDRLRDANLKLQPDKCDFLRTEVAYLGHIIGRDGVKPNPAKINAIRKFPRPTTVRAIRQFLGLSGYYRRFIKDYAKIAKPLSDLLKKDIKWEWGCSQRRSFRKLRRYLCRTPILLYPEFQKTFKLTTDASDHAVGAILTQEKDGVDMPVAYFSKTMNACEQKYAKAEKECLAVLYAVMNFRPYLYGREFILACDYEPIHWITYVENPGARLLRWRLRPQDYQYKFEYKQGKLNRGVEALSGNPATDTDSTCSTESSEDSDNSEVMSRSNSPSQRKSNSEITRTSGDSPTGSRKQVLVIRNKVEVERSKPVTRSVTQQARPGFLQVAPSTSGRVPRPTKTAKAKKEIAVISKPSIAKGKPSITRSTAFKPAKSKTIVATTQKEVEPTALKARRADPRRRVHLHVSVLQVLGSLLSRHPTLTSSLMALAATTGKANPEPVLESGLVLTTR